MLPLLKLVSAIGTLEMTDEYRDLLLRWLDEALTAEYQRGRESVLCED